MEEQDGKTQTFFAGRRCFDIDNRTLDRMEQRSRIGGLCRNQLCQLCVGRFAFRVQCGELDALAGKVFER